MGSSHFWDSKIDCGLRNLVPVLIVEKIISKIVAKQDFTAYILVPMFPEGIPDTVGVQVLIRYYYLQLLFAIIPKIPFYSVVSHLFFFFLGDVEVAILDRLHDAQAYF